MAFKKVLFNIGVIVLIYSSIVIGLRVLPLDETKSKEPTVIIRTIELPSSEEAEIADEVATALDNEADAQANEAQKDESNAAATEEEKMASEKPKPTVPEIDKAKPFPVDMPDIANKPRTFSLREKPRIHIVKREPRREQQIEQDFRPVPMPMPERETYNREGINVGIVNQGESDQPDYVPYEQ